MKNLKKYWNKRVDRVVSLISKKRSRRSANYYHDLRIEIKKIKALFELLQFYSSKFNRKSSLRPFKKLFEKAGSIREIQMERKMLAKYLQQTQSRYLDILLNVQNKYEQSFTQIKFTKVVEEILSKKKRVGKFFADIKRKAAEAYVVKMKRKIIKMLSVELDDKDVHEVRKKLKTLHYNIAQLQVESEILDGKQWTRFLDLLGRWHDCEVAIRHLKKFVRKTKNGRVRVEEVSNILFNLTREKARLLARINRSATF
jgi:CHAD domain-containing protein